MKTIGVDIGTTTICGVLIDADSGILLTSKTLPNTAVLTSSNIFENKQDPDQILSICKEIIDSFLGENKEISSIGITGQMHGIVYTDGDGFAVSPLYTWQDERGNQIYKDDLSYAQYLTQKTGIQMATGFGLTTHFYNLVNQLIPETAVTFCTIPDFIAMSLTNEKQPLLHPSMAASLGLYDLQNNCFNKNALTELGIQEDFLPSIAASECILGTTKEQIPVAISFGDNQASYLGSVNHESNLLVNVGTGSQISVCCEEITSFSQSEYRPYINKLYLMAGSPLCGGYSYALLKNFFEETLQMFKTTTEEAIYESMNKAATEIYDSTENLIIDTRFNGTRVNASLTGSIKNLTANTLHPAHLILGVLQGICNELYDFFKEFPDELKKSPLLIGSGNGIRMNTLLQKVFCDTFNMSLKIPMYSEEAAYGSALFSLYAMRYYKTLEEIQKLIKYQ